jgi:hypothetical protein
MALFTLASIAEVTQATPHLRAPVHDRRNPSDLAFGAWASIALIGLAVVSVALGRAPVDPAIFASP